MAEPTCSARGEAAPRAQGGGFLLNGPRRTVDGRGGPVAAVNSNASPVVVTDFEGD